MIGERIKKLRKTLDLTQQGFCERIGIKRNTIAKYETNRGEPIDAVVSLICREFNVSETWLRTGEGEMFIQKEPQPLDKLLYDLLGGETVTDEDRVLVKNFLELPDASRRVVIEFVKKCSAELSAQVVDEKNTTSTPAPDTSGRTTPDIAAELAELKRKNQELAAKVAAMEEEDALLGLTGAFSASPSVSAGSSRPTEKVKK